MDNSLYPVDYKPETITGSVQLTGLFWRSLLFFCSIASATPFELSSSIALRELPDVITSSALVSPTFLDFSGASGISSRKAFKYGGPMIADLNGDGWDDVVLGEHENGNARVYLWESERSFVLAYEHPGRIDYHGMAAYNVDGTRNTLDVIMSKGGVNGQMLNAPDVFKCLPSQNTFERFPGSAFNLGQYESRGRAVLMIDVDLDGHEDMIMTGRTSNDSQSRSELVVLRGSGADGWTVYDDLRVKNSFCYTAILTIDLDNDAIMDLICTERGRISVLRGTGRFPDPFEDETENWLGSIFVAKDGFYDYMADLDYDNDGKMDVYVTCGLNYTFADCDDVLLRNDGRKFVDVSSEAGIPRGGIHQEPAVGDFNLDGFIDMLIPSYGTKRAPSQNLLLINRGDGTFETTWSHGVNMKPSSPYRGAGARALLTDRGGHLDVIMGYEGGERSGGGPYKFYKNRTPMTRMQFLAFKVNDIPSSNLLARGARVTVRIGERTMIRQVGSVGGESQSFQRRVHFGLGNATTVDSVVVEYLGGATRLKRNVRPGFRQGYRR